MRIMKIWSVEPIRRTVYTSISSQTTPIQSIIENLCDEIFLSSNQILDIFENTNFKLSTLSKIQISEYRQSRNPPDQSTI